jgi:hypothetical protein
MGAAREDPHAPRCLGSSPRRVHLEEAHTWKERTLLGKTVTRIFYSTNIVFNGFNNLPTYSKITFVGIT